MKNCQRYPEQNLAAFYQHQVPQSYKHIEVEAVSKHCDEPLKDQATRHDKIAGLLKVLVKLWESRHQQVLDDFLVYASTKHALEVVRRQDVLNYGGESPKSFFFAHHLQKASNYKIEALAVAYMRVSVAVGSANT